MHLTDERKNRTYAFAFSIAAVVAMVLCLCLALPRVICADGEPMRLNSTINPNDAPIGSLMRLPGVGPSRANAIVTYREDFEKETGRRAFESAADLTKVKGIGPKTTEKIGPWLEF